MTEKKTLDRISIYIPSKKADRRIVERLLAVGAKEERSVNYLLIKAAEEFLARYEEELSE